MSLFTEDPFDEGVENEEMPTAKRPRDETDAAEEGDEPVASKPRLEEDTPSADPTTAVVEMHPEEDAAHHDSAVDLVHQDQEESTAEVAEQEQNIAPGQEEEDFTTLDQEEAALDEASHQQTMSEAIAAASVAAANHQSSLEAFEAAKRQWDVERQTQRVAMEALLAENKSLRSTASKTDGSDSTTSTAAAAAAAAVASEMDLESRRWLVLTLESAERRQVEAERKAAQQTLLCQVATRNAQVWKQVASAAAASSLSPPNSFLTTAAATTSCAVAEDVTAVHNSNSNQKNIIVDRLRTVLREGTKRAIQRLQERDELDPSAKEIRSRDAEVESEAPETVVAPPSVSLSEKREALVSFIQFLCDQAVAACDARCALQEQNRILGMENERMNQLLVQIAQHSAEPRLVLLHQASQRHVQLAAPSIEELEESRERRRLQQRVSVLEAVLASQLPPHGLSNATAVVPHVLAEQLSTSDRLQRELEGARSENAYLRRLIVDHHQAALVEASNQSPLSAPSGASAPSPSLDTLLINACRRWSHAARVAVDVLFQQQQQSAPLELLTEGKYRAYEAQVTILNRALADLTAENVSLRNAQSVARASIDVLRRSLSAVAWDGESMEKAVELMDPLTRSPNDNQVQPTSVVVEGAVSLLRDVLAQHLQQVSEVFQRREVQHLRVQQALTALLQSAHEALYETVTATRGDGAQEGGGKELPPLPPVLPSFQSTPYRLAADLFTVTIQSSASPASVSIEDAIDRNTTTTKVAMEALEKSFEQELQKLRSRLEWYRSHRGYQGAKQLEESQSTLTVTLAKLKECDARLSKLTRTEEELNLTKLLVETQKKRIDSLESQLKVSQESLSKSRAEQTRTGKALDEKTAEAQSLAQKAARFESMEKEANTYRQQLEEANELVSRLMRAEEERQQAQRQQQEAAEQLSNTADGEGLPQDDVLNQPQENAEGGETSDEQMQQDYEEAEGASVGEQEEVVEEGGDTEAAIAEDFEELDEGATPFDGEEVEAEADTEHEAPATAVTEESALEPQSETDVDPSAVVAPEEGDPNTTLVARSVLQQADEDFGDSDEEDLNNADGINPELAE